MTKAYVLLARTAGGDGLASITSVVAVSIGRDVIEKLKAERAAEREAIRSDNNKMPAWIRQSMVDMDEIVEADFYGT